MNFNTVVLYSLGFPNKYTQMVQCAMFSSVELCIFMMVFAFWLRFIHISVLNVVRSMFFSSLFVTAKMLNR